MWEVCGSALRVLHRFPADFPVVGYQEEAVPGGRGRGFPADFPVVGSQAMQDAGVVGRGFPADFPVVGSLSKKVLNSL